jgi:hypothetical protein
MNDFTFEEQQLIERIRGLQPYEKIEVRLKNNELGEVMYIITTNERFEYGI